MIFNTRVPGRTSALNAAIVLGLGLLVLSACGEKNEAGPAVTPSTEFPVEETAAFEPKITVSSESQEIIAKDRFGADIKFLLNVQTPSLSGAEASVVEEFDTAFDESVAAWMGHLTEVVADLDAQSLSCQTSQGCEIPVEVESTVAEVYDGVGTVLTTSGVQLGTTSRSYSVDSFTLDLTTGDEVPVEKFVELSDDSVSQRIGRAVSVEVAKDPSCVGSDLNFTGETAWSPTEEGVVLAWDQRSVVSNACGYVVVTIPWDEEGPDDLQNDARGLVIPACEEQATSETLDELMFRLENTETGNQLSEEQSGPAAQAAMASAKQVQACEYWPAIAGDVMEVITISELNDAARDDFIAQLRASDYEESAFEGGILFLLHIDSGTRNASFSRHLFAGNAWINQRGNGGLEAISEIALTSDALASLRAVNPGL